VQVANETARELESYGAFLADATGQAPPVDVGSLRRRLVLCVEVKDSVISHGLSQSEDAKLHPSDATATAASRASAMVPTYLPTWQPAKS
jgi:hypothetical protein